MSQIYKLCQINSKNEINRYYVFTGNKFKETPLNELFSKEPQKGNFKDIFSDKEITLITGTNIDVVFVNENFIYPDDSISTIKNKLLLALNRQISFSELYTFIVKKREINPIEIYEILTQNGKMDLTKEHIIQFLSNITNTSSIDMDAIEEKDSYSFNDILALNLEGNEYYIKEPFGQKIFLEKGKLIFTTNPTDTTFYDDFQEKHIDNYITTLNGDLLIDSYPFMNNIIYFCTAEDALEYSIENDLDEETTIKVYYPMLSRENITSLEQLKGSQQRLIETDNKYINDKTEVKYENIQLLNNIYNERTSDLQYLDRGIKNLSILINPLYTFKLPLDMIFKLIHSTKNIPLIKFNPGSRQENIYRLYTNKTAKDGKKIPYLSKGTIFKVAKNIAKSKVVSFYIQHFIDGKLIPIICEIDDNAGIKVDLEFDQGYDIKIINDIIQTTVNPLIVDIKNFLEQSGYTISLFESIDDENVDILNLQYFAHITITKDVKLQPFIKCVSSIFNLIGGTLNKGISLRYKRVANYNEVDSQTAFVMEQFKSGLRSPDIIPLLQENFSMSVDESRKFIANVLSELQTEEGARQNKRLKIKNNPGFLTKIIQDQFKSNIVITVDSIDNINYLDSIHVYLDTIIRLTQNIDSTNIPRAIINKLCLGKTETEEAEVIKDVVAKQEQGVDVKDLQPRSDTIKELQFFQEEPSDMDDILALLGEEDEEEEDEDEDEDEEEGLAEGKKLSKGGATEDSEESLGSIPMGLSDESDESVVDNPLDDSQSPAVGLSDESDESVAEPLQIKTPSPVVGLSDESEESVAEPLQTKTPSPAVGLSDESEESVAEPLQIKTPSPVVNLSTEPEQEPEQESEQEPEQESEQEPEQEPEQESEQAALTKPVTSPQKSPSSRIESTEGLSGVSEMDVEMPRVDIAVEEEQQTPEQQEEEKEIEDDEKETGLKEQETIEELDTLEDEPEEFKNIDGMSMTHPNPIFERLHSRDPALFLTQDKGNFKQYSRMCGWNVRRQPIVLSDKEKERIDRHHPGSYKEAIKYGSSPENQNWYICPRYWCLLNNTSLTEEEVKAGACGGKIIPHNAKKVPPGAYILEFTHPTEHITEDGKYIDHSPGFLKPSQHPDGKCVPCCFKNFNSPDQISRRTLCNKSAEEIKKLSKQARTDAVDNYIKGADKFPLDPQRWGYLPLTVQKFLLTDNQKCQISNVNQNLKPYHTCILRKGVELDEKQSFIGCLADLYADYNDGIILSIKDMKNVIIKSLTIDKFIVYQNGNLFTEFRLDDKFDINLIDITRYKESKIYQSFIKKQTDLKYMKQLVASYENFMQFLLNNEIEIDYTYLWDIVCTANDKLFPKGLNLVILNQMDTDITDNIELICPSNHYATKFYKVGGNTVFLLKYGQYYEPIYAYRDEEKSIKITKTFNEYSNQLIPNIREVLHTVKAIYEKNCSPLASLPRVYEFKTNVLLEKLINELGAIDFLIKKQIVNYQNKVIGVIINGPSMSGDIFVPCFPSAILTSMTYIYMDDPSLEWNNYTNTVSGLKQLSINSNGKILSLPVIKVIDDGLIVGIITETNQFVQIMPPEENIYDDELIVQSNSNYIVADSEIAFNQEKDVEREKVIKHIKLESNFYNVFRNSIKVLISDAKNMIIREKIQNIIDDEELLYTNKLTTVIQILKELTAGVIFFTEYKSEILEEIDNITGCINNSKETCSTKKFCLVSKEGNCQLLIPKRNLITNNYNETIYFGRISDELIRYNRIKHFMFNPNDFLTFTNIGYNLLPTEIILLQSLLTQEYFDNMIPVIKNPYVSFNTYDTAQPFITQAYDKKSVKEFDDTSQVCAPSKKPTISGKWKTMLPSNAHELIFGATPACSFELMVMLINKHTDTNVDSFLLKKILLEQYYKYIKKYKDEIMNILSNEGKKLFTHQIYYNQLTLETLIISESYYLTNFDIWLLSDVYKLPIILLSSTMLKEYNDNILITMRSETNKYYVIKSPGIQSNIASKYRLISLPGLEIQIELSDFPANMIQLITDIVNDTNTSHNKIVSLDEYLTNFKFDKPKKKAPKKIKILSKSEKPDKVDEVISQIQPPEEVAVQLPIAKKSKKVGRIKLLPKSVTSSVPIESQPEQQEPSAPESIGSELLERSNLPDMQDIQEEDSQPRFIDEGELKLMTPEDQEELLLSKALIKPPTEISRKPTFSKIRINPVSSLPQTIAEREKPEEPIEEQPIEEQPIEEQPIEERSEVRSSPPFKSIMIKPKSRITEDIEPSDKPKKTKKPFKKIQIKSAISPKSPLSLDNLITENPMEETE